MPVLDHNSNPWRSLRQGMAIIAILMLVAAPIMARAEDNVLDKVGHEIGETLSHEIGQSLEGDAHHPEAEHVGGLPQMNPAHFASQIFWMLLVFLVLFQILRRRILPRYAEVLEEREEKIAGDLGRAEALRLEAEAAEAHYQASLTEARRVAHEALIKAQEQAAADSASRLAKVDSSIKGRITKAENRIAEEKQAALGELASIVTDAVRDSVDRIAGLKTADDEVESAIRKVMEVRG